MTQINITEFSTYTNSDIYEFLLIQDETEFEIVLPKQTFPLDDNQLSVVMEYTAAAYAGHLLNDISGTFSYLTPSPYKPVDFLFQVEHIDCCKLADLITLFIAAFDYTNDDEDYVNFRVAAANFLHDAFENNITCKTWGLLYIANEFLGD